MKTFQTLDLELMKPLQKPRSPSPALRALRPRALPTPDPSVMKRALSGIVTHGSMSAGKLGSTEAESAHSASKLSAAKLLNVKRRSRVSSNPNIRKKLVLCSECWRSFLVCVNYLICVHILFCFSIRRTNPYAKHHMLGADWLQLMIITAKNYCTFSLLFVSRVKSFLLAAFQRSCILIKAAQSEPWS